MCWYGHRLAAGRLARLCTERSYPSSGHRSELGHRRDYDWKGATDSEGGVIICTLRPASHPFAMMTPMSEQPRAEVIEIEGLRWTAGAPTPFVVSSELRSFFGFDAPLQEWTDENSQVRVAELVGCTSVQFGFPNDEVLNGHPLYGRGLTPYAAHVVDDSPWLAELRRVESHHPLAGAVPFENARHFLLSFHDSTLEAIATDIAMLAAFPDSLAAASWMVEQAFPGNEW